MIHTRDAVIVTTLFSGVLIAIATAPGLALGPLTFVIIVLLCVLLVAQVGIAVANARRDLRLASLAKNPR